MNQKVVFRMDLLSRKSFPKEQLFRLVKKDNHLVLDLNESVLGRGIYLKKDKETIEKVFQKKMLFRYAPESDFEALKKELLQHAQ